MPLEEAKIPDFLGLNTTRDPSRLEPPIAKGVMLEKLGQVEKRPGYRRVNQRHYNGSVILINDLGRVCDYGKVLIINADFNFGDIGDGGDYFWDSPDIVEHLPNPSPTPSPSPLPPPFPFPPSPVPDPPDDDLYEDEYYPPEAFLQYESEKVFLFQFYSNLSWDPNGLELGFLWDFGDGGFSFDANPSYEYLADGTYTVILTVINTAGKYSQVQETFTLVNGVPTAVASASPLSGDPPLTVSFVGENSTDPDGHDLTYDWDFDDGSAHSTEANPDHTYAAPGTFNPSLTVADKYGGSDTDSHLNVTVSGWATPLVPEQDLGSEVKCVIKHSDGYFYCICANKNLYRRASDGVWSVVGTAPANISNYNPSLFSWSGDIFVACIDGSVRRFNGAGFSLEVQSSYSGSAALISNGLHLFYTASTFAGVVQYGARRIGAGSWI